MDRDLGRASVDASYATIMFQALCRVLTREADSKKWNIQPLYNVRRVSAVQPWGRFLEKQ